MSTEYPIVIEKDEDGYYVGSVPGLPGCHTQGKSIDQLLERMQEASHSGLKSREKKAKTHRRHYVADSHSRWDNPNRNRKPKTDKTFL